MCLLVLFNGSVLSQTTWEFSGTPYAYQKAHFDSATKVIKTKLGVQMRTFGAPYNQIDATLLQVMREDTNYKAIYLGQSNPHPSSGQLNFNRRVQIENGTGIPDYNYFLTDYNAKKPTYTDYMVMQGHPYAWTTPAKLTEFQNIVNFLISDSVVFNTAYGYYKYLTDLSIPRTNKVQVLLKLDDLRAASSYFYPCLPTYDFLVTKKVKAGFGVNKMEALSQAQIDTLHYYLSQTDASGDSLFEIWNHGLDHSMNSVVSGGNWSSAASWPSGAVPTASDDVVIPAGVTVTIDVANAVCKDLIVDGTLVALNTSATALTVYGDVLINSTGSFTSPSLSSGTSNIIHSLSVYGDFTNAGGTFDFRMGSAGTTMRVMNTSFLGNLNSVITVGTYSPSNNDFNGITVNKSGGAKVICASDVFLDQGASTCVSQLVMTNGLVETGNYAIHVLSTTSADLVTPSATSYISGALGRGMSNSAGKSNLFPIGDANAYRPITVRSTTAGVASGHYVLVRCIPGNANSGSSTLSGGIDAVSSVRYYQVGYNKGVGSGATTMTFDRVSPSYGSDDGVVEGNTDLRVASSIDNRAIWTAAGQTTPHTTTLTSPPTTITPDAFASTITLNSGAGSFLVTLANAAGGVNPLPIQLASFTARALGGGTVLLEWATISEITNYGFEIQRRGGGQTQFETLPNSFVPGHGTTVEPHSYSFVDLFPLTGEQWYRLRQIDLSGAIHFSNPISVANPTGVDVQFAPTEFHLSQNYPNPFNPSTEIKFSVDVAGRTTLKVYNILGQVVATLFDGLAESGRYYQVRLDVPHFASGTYFYRLNSGNKTEVRKMLLMR